MVFLLIVTVCVVAPLAGAWIEITELTNIKHLHYVAPLAGAWIEMQKFGVSEKLIRSLPLRERGLKWHGRGERER